MSDTINKQASAGPVMIGTSGFRYNHWVNEFYPSGLKGREYLAYYATKFPTVEVSSTFHRMPEERVLRGWDESTPPGFVFAIRAPHAVTHEAHLVGCGPLMSTFAKRLEVLGAKLGPVTFQLQQSQPFDPNVLEAFLCSLPSGFKYSMEFRSEPWYCDRAVSLLRQHDVATVVVGHSDMGIHTVPSANWSHVRMSGHNPDYKANSYTDDQLKNWRGIIADAPKPAYVYFNNEYRAFAAHNAARMTEIVGRTAVRLLPPVPKVMPLTPERTRVSPDVGGGGGSASTENLDGMEPNPGADAREDSPRDGPSERNIVRNYPDCDPEGS